MSNITIDQTWLDARTAPYWLLTGNTYTLGVDVSTAGSTFMAKGDSIVLDLNGHTITYGTSSGDSVYGVFTDWNIVGLRVTNGIFSQGAGNGYLCAAIYSQQASNLEIDHLTINYQGDNNRAVWQVGGGYAHNITIHDNTILPNGTKRNASGLDYPDHYSPFAAISVSGTGGSVHIDSNDIEGKGYLGIGFGYSTALTETLTINSNTIKMAAPVRDGYAISVNSSDSVEIGFEIANNTIVQASGRGILVAGNYDQNSLGPGTGTIHNNNIDVKESGDQEYNAPGTAIGIQLRFGAHNIQVYNNTVIARAGVDIAPPQFATTPNGDGISYGIKIFAGSTATNNLVYNNTVTADTTDAELTATGLYGCGISNGTNIFQTNSITSNSMLVDLNGADGPGRNYVFDSNTFIKGATPLGFVSMRVVNSENATNNVFLNNTWQGGAAVTNTNAGYNSNGYTWSFYLKWYLTITVQDSDSQPITGADVSAVSIGAGSETVTGTTDESGICILTLTDCKIYGVDNSATLNYTYYTPHTVTISKTAFADGAISNTTDSSKSVTVTLQASGGNASSYTISTGGVVSWGATTSNITITLVGGSGIWTGIITPSTDGDGSFNTIPQWNGESGTKNFTYSPGSNAKPGDTHTITVIANPALGSNPDSISFKINLGTYPHSGSLLT